MTDANNPSLPAPQIPLNFIPFSPSLSDAFDLLKKDLSLNLNCHHVGTIQSFDPSLQSCTATINYPQTYFQLNPMTGLYSPTQINYDVLVDCPAIVISGGTGALTMPIQAGDECLILFNDRDFSSWWQGASGAPVPTPRTHSFADAIALVGLRSNPKVLNNYDMVRATLRGGSAVVGTNTDNNKVLITNATPSVSDGAYSYSTTLNTLLQSLLTQLENLCTAINSITVGSGTFSAGGTPVTGTSSTPNNSSTISDISTNISTIATQIGNLLE